MKTGEKLKIWWKFGVSFGLVLLFQKVTFRWGIENQFTDHFVIPESVSIGIEVYYISTFVGVLFAQCIWLYGNIDRKHFLAGLIFWILSTVPALFTFHTTAPISSEDMWDLLYVQGVVPSYPGNFLIDFYFPLILCVIGASVLGFIILIYFTTNSSITEVFHQLRIPLWVRYCIVALGAFLITYIWWTPVLVIFGELTIWDSPCHKFMYNQTALLIVFELFIIFSYLFIPIQHLKNKIIVAVTLLIGILPYIITNYLDYYFIFSHLFHEKSMWDFLLMEISENSEYFWNPTILIGEIIVTLVILLVISFLPNLHDKIMHHIKKTQEMKKRHGEYIKLLNTWEGPEHARIREHKRSYKKDERRYKAEDGGHLGQ
ncbi:MAG: hypothetical protein QXQ54_08375 [Thermoplasmata archaeon]